MKAITQEVHGKDLPELWRKQAEVSPDDVVIVSIQPQKSVDDLTHRLLEIAEQVSAEAKKRGLTEQELLKILEEKHDFVAQALSDVLQEDSIHMD